MKYTSNYKFKKPEPLETRNINDINDTTDLVDSVLKKIEDKNTHLETTFNQLTINAGGSNAEIVDARVDKNNNIFPKVGDRLDHFDSQLSQIASVSPLRFGAKADKITDDTTALQSAIDYAFSNKMSLNLSGIQMYIAGTITLPNYIKIYGNFSAKQVVSSINDSQSLIITNGQNLFKGATVIYLDSVAFISGRLLGGLGGICFTGGLNQSRVTNCYWYGFDTIFNDGIGTVTHIDNNFSINTHISFIKGVMVDSYVHDNYINGNGSNTKMFDLSNFGLGSIYNNFIDFATYGIYVANGTGGSIINNVIDYCWHGVDMRGINDCIIANNTFSHISKADCVSRIPDGVLHQNDNWSGVYLYNSISHVSITDNTAPYTDNIIEMTTNAYKDITTKGNQGNILLNRSVADWFVDDGKNLLLSELNYKTYDSFPAITNTFDGHIIYINNKLVKNANGNWNDFNGDLFGYRTKNLIPLFNNSAWKDNNGTVLNSASQCTITNDGYTVAIALSTYSGWYSASCSLPATAGGKYRFNTKTTAKASDGTSINYIEIHFFNGTTEISVITPTIGTTTDYFFTAPSGIDTMKVFIKTNSIGNSAIWTFDTLILNQYSTSEYGKLFKSPSSNLRTMQYGDDNGNVISERYL